MIQPDNASPTLFVLPDLQSHNADHVSLADVISQLDNILVVEMAQDRLQKIQQLTSEAMLLLAVLAKRSS